MVDTFFIVQKKRFDIEVTISCHTNNENEPDFTIDSVVGAKIKELEFPSISKSGYYFDGWYYSPDFSGEEVTSDSNAGYFLNNIYAKWTEMGTNCNEFEVVTTTENQFVGFYSITKSSTSKYIFIDWGDGTCEILSENASKLEHKYVTAGTYSLKINDSITKIQFGASDYYSVGEGIKEWISIGSKYSKPTSLSQYEFSGIGFRNLSFLDWFTSVTSIPSYCFSRAKLTSLQGMPSRITSLNTYCFQYCENLTSLEGLGTGLTTIPSYCFYYSRITSLTGLHSGITSLQTYAFAYCQYLTDISGLANGSFTSLPNYCFYYCTRLASTATLPSKITSLGSSCFRNCTSLTNLSGIRSSVSLGTYCFSNCSSLVNLSTLPNRTSLPNYCFYSCSGITSLSLGSTYTSLGTNCFAICTSLQTVDLSQSGLNSLPSNCFSGCTSLRSVTFKNPMAGSIGTNCFQNCNNANFTTLEIPEGVTSLGNYCFNYCYNLKSVTIPSTCTSLGSYCFAGCRQIKDLYCLRSSAPSTSTYTFGYSTSNGSYTYTGYTTKGTNTLWVNSGASGYDSGLWLSPLQNANQCGFTKQEIGGGDEDWGDGEREYLESDGRAAINTGIQPILNSTKMVAEICMGNSSGNVFFGMSGTQTGSDSADFRFFIANNNSSVYWDYDGQRMEKSTTSVGIVNDLKSWYHIECSNGRFQVNDTVYNLTNAMGTIGTGTIYIGQDANLANVTEIFKIRNFKVFNGDTLVGNFVPWVKDGVPCMYDTVTQQFFYNAHSSGFFKAGPPMTDGQKLWMKSTGTQYISTDYIPNNTSGFKIKAVPSKVADQIAFGCRTITEGRWWSNFGSINLNWSWNGYGNSSFTYATSAYYTQKTNYLNDRQILWNDSVVKQITETLANQTYPAYIFAGNSIGSTINYFNGKIFDSIEVTEGTSIVHNYVPYVLDHVPCMYDTITSSYFYNKGTGEFTPGPPISGETYVSSYVQNGLCVLYDGIENTGTGIHDSEALFWYNHATKNNDGLMKSDVKWEKDSFLNSSSGKPCEIQISDLYSVMNTSRTFTMEFLVKPSRTSTRECFFSNYNGYNSIGIEHNSGSVSDGKIRAWYAGNPDMYSNSTVLSGETAFVTITSTPSEHKIYKNGVLDATNTQSIGTYSSTYKYVVGGEQQRAVMAFYGNYYLFHLYNRVLSDSEILSNYTVASEKYLPPAVTKSFHFDGTTAGNILSAINYSTGSYVDPINKSWSIWAKCDSAPGGKEFFKFSSIALGYGNSSNMDNNGNYVWVLYEVIAWKLKWQNTNMDTNWHHYCLTISSNGTPSIYYDGQLVATGSSGNFSNTATAYGIGGASISNSARNFSGYLTRFCIFNKTLTASEVLEDFTRRNLYPTNVSTTTYVNMDVVNGIVKDHIGNYDLKILGTSEQTTEVLPPYDARIEYLESTGTQYIDTEKYLVFPISVELTMAMIPPYGSTSYDALPVFGRRGSNSDKIAIWFQKSSLKYALNYGSYDSGYVLPVTQAAQKVVLKIANGANLYLDGNLIASSQDVITNNQNRTLILFMMGEGDGSIASRSQCLRVYSCKIWNESVLLRDFIPVRCGSTGFMYDQVSGKLFGNSGTGNFVLGPDI